MDTLKMLKDLGVRNIKYLAKGKRGIIYTGTYKGKKVAVKVKRPESKATGRITNEYLTLKKINRHNIGPKVIRFPNGQTPALIYAFVEGMPILEFLEKNNKKSITLMLERLLGQLYVLDTLRLNKEEMTRPHKHVYIQRNQPVMLDFERTYQAKKPHNVTQFLQFLMQQQLLLSSKGMPLNREEVITAAKHYKQKPSKEHFEGILRALSFSDR